MSHPGSDDPMGSGMSSVTYRFSTPTAWQRGCTSVLVRTSAAMAQKEPPHDPIALDPPPH